MSGINVAAIAGAHRPCLTGVRHSRNSCEDKWGQSRREAFSSVILAVNK